MEPCVRLQHVATVKSPVDGVPWSPHLLPRAEGEPFFAIVPDKSKQEHCVFEVVVWEQQVAMGEQTESPCDHAGALQHTSQCIVCCSRCTRLRRQIWKSERQNRKVSQGALCKPGCSAKKGTHHSNVYLLCLSVLHCSVLFFALVYSALIF